LFAATTNRTVEGKKRGSQSGSTATKAMDLLEIGPFTSENK